MESFRVTRAHDTRIFLVFFLRTMRGQGGRLILAVVRSTHETGNTHGASASAVTKDLTQGEGSRVCPNSRECYT